MVNLFHRYPMNVAAHWGATPLHFAVENQSETLLQLFLENGANPSAIDRNGRTALEVARKRRDDTEERIRELEAKRAIQQACVLRLSKGAKDGKLSESNGFNEALETAEHPQK